MALQERSVAMLVTAIIKVSNNCCSVVVEEEHLLILLLVEHSGFNWLSLYNYYR